MAHYAWSDIRGGTAEKPVLVTRGSKVTQSELGLSDANWQEMLDSGAVRDKQFPAPDDYQGSALDYLRDQLAEAQAVSPLDEEEAVVELAALETAPEGQVVEEKKSGTSKK